ncbi:hypothetical protein O3G_MSEX005714 [Manduca sexta]|uniref:RRM domain-containing protein n=1 Tax=Manduca sexta TaxID=7130 RepID=A0A921Z160_MANSE|nr:hypothetical protein O3G_MSEX005714 [Manduca sexta]
MTDCCTCCLYIIRLVVFIVSSSVDVSRLLQVRTLFVSGLPMDAKPRELYLLFRAYEGYEGSLLKVTSKNGKTASVSLGKYYVRFGCHRRRAIRKCPLQFIYEIILIRSPWDSSRSIPEPAPRQPSKTFSNRIVSYAKPMHMSNRPRVVKSVPLRHRATRHRASQECDR